MFYGVHVFYNIGQLCTPCFPIGLVKTESDFIDRSVQTGLERWTLVVAVISVDAYTVLTFLDLTCHLEDTEIVSPGCTALLGSKETNLGSSNQEASPSASKNTILVLVLSRAWNCVPTAISGGVDISEVPGYHLFPQISSQ